MGGVLQGASSSQMRKHLGGKDDLSDVAPTVMPFVLAGAAFRGIPAGFPGLAQGDQRDPCTTKCDTLWELLVTEVCYIWALCFGGGAAKNPLISKSLHARCFVAHLVEHFVEIVRQSCATKCTAVEYKSHTTENSERTGKLC